MVGAGRSKVHGVQMMAVASLGLVVNGLTAWILGRSGAEDLNTKSAFLHMIGDLFSSVVIVAGGLVMIATGWVWIDPALSAVVAALIMAAATGLLFGLLPAVRASNLEPVAALRYE